MQIAALYIRVSTEDQTEYSPEAQRKALIDYAKRNDMVVPDQFIFEDAGISGRKAEKRPAFMQMIGTAKQKPRPFDVILVHKFDRFARSREDSIVYKSLLRRECGVQVISITEHIEDDKFSVILEAMLEAMAEYYSLNLSDEVKKGMTEKALRGEIQSGAAFGYTIEDNKLIVNPVTAHIVKKMYKDYLSGKSAFAIARELNDRGIKTTRGNKFENRTVTYILENPVYKGYIRWNPVRKSDIRAKKHDMSEFIIAKGSHEPIVSEEVFEEVQKRIDYTYRPRKRPTESRMHWLSGLIHCSSCGGVMVASAGGFQCSKYAKGVCIESHYCATPKLEASVLSSIEDVLDGNDTFHHVPKSRNEYTEEIKSLQAELKKLEFKADRIRDAYESGIDTIDEYKVNKNRVSADIRKVTDRIEDYKNRVSIAHIDDFMTRLRTAYEVLISSADKSIKSNAAESIINNIIYNKKTETVDIYYISD